MLRTIRIVINIVIGIISIGWGSWTIVAALYSGVSILPSVVFGLLLIGWGICMFLLDPAMVWRGNLWGGPWGWADYQPKFRGLRLNDDEKEDDETEGKGG